MTKYHVQVHVGSAGVNWAFWLVCESEGVGGVAERLARARDLLNDLGMTLDPARITVSWEPPPPQEARDGPSRMSDSEAARIQFASHILSRLLELDPRERMER